MRRREELFRDLPELADLNLQRVSLLQIIYRVEVDGSFETDYF
jgi:hypothetical protein